ncbi:DegT/DnrJ/EryC1/StrS family aminotransferase [Paremcibacter congregatus]|uniref:Spore coat protein n=1 Tax=Paremcibacter congregatus TaxID=2043170 RepID=A0A2G4YRB2_9PROT|nr:DegT/DnrJ/EryC1/StrS aminotransferase family protein [Paremcibacter congregatus]PHZ84848.1 spore coat protein [Paremcibacter congregatus]QDE26179.1 DegT/DnrJ/EryC1/StrS aminotransferase family protein [Paremcibacter congregatus]
MDKVKLIEPYISFDQVEDGLKDIFESGQFTRGRNVLKFSEDLKAYTSAKHAFLVTSATTALTMCLKALGIVEGDDVLVSDFSFPATANVVEDMGARPIFVDVQRDSFNMCPEDLKTKITDNIKALIFVDALGSPSGIEAVMDICRQHNIPVIEDAACAIGSSSNGIKTGAIADMTCFSFHPRKLLCTGEGGAILTNLDKYADFLESKLMHGAKGTRGLGMDFLTYGYNYRMSEIQALLGHTQLAELDNIVRDRQKMYEAYCEQLIPLGFKAQKINAFCEHNIQSAVFTLPEAFEQVQFAKYLGENGIEATLGTYCLSGTTYYKNKYDDVQPNAWWLESNTITLPCHNNVDVGIVCDVIISYLAILKTV